MTPKYLPKIFIFFFVSIFLCIPLSQAAATVGEVKGDVAVAATVPSKVSAVNSTVTANVKEVLADGIQKFVITVTLHDVSDNPLPNIKVVLTSNRGDIDTINALSGVDETNAEGMVYFEVSSNVPGKSILTALADNMVTLNSVTVTFLPLPFPKNVTISVEVPKFISSTGEVVLLKPSSENEDRASGEKAEKTEKDKIVNLGVNVRVPFWLVTVALASAFMNIVLFVLVTIMLVKLRKAENKEEKILEKEEKILEEIDGKL